MPPQTTSRRVVVRLVLATAALALAGCQLPGDDEPRLSLPGLTPIADEPVSQPNEFVDSGERPCPPTLPIGDDPSGHGFGTQEVANELPSLLEPEKAWTCRYNNYEVGGPKAGTSFGWTRDGQPEPVAATHLDGLRAALDGVVPADRSDGCTDDLGPRWMVVYSHQGDFTGVLVDDYGCRDIRLTDNPHDTPAGAADQDGTVGGVLDGGTAILDAVGVGRSD